MKKTHYSVLALVLALMLALSACSTTPAKSPEDDANSSAGTATETGTDTETSAPADTDGGSKHVELLRIGTTSSNDSFNLTTQGGSFGVMNYNSFVAGLFWERDEHGKPQPGAIKDYSISDDNRSITVFLPEDLYWHDGRQVTSDDIIFTFEYSRDVLLSSKLKDIVLTRDGDYHATVTFPEGESAFAFVNGQTSWLKIYPKHIWENVTDNKEYTGEDRVIGCGPYRFVSVDEDAQLAVYEAVEHYWKGELLVDKVTVKTYASQEAEVMALRNGEIDAIYNYSGPIAATLFPTLEGEQDCDLGISPDPGNYMIMFGYNEAPTNDYAFREAVTLALNYDIFGQTIYGQYYTVPTKGVIPTPNMGYDASLPAMKYDPDAAAAALDAAGYVDTDSDGYREDPNGQELNVLITPQNNKSRAELLTRIAAVIADNLDKVGIKTTLDEESLTSREAWSARSENGGTYQIYIGYCTAGIASYIGAPMYIVNYTETGWWGTWQDPAYMDAYNKVRASASFEEYESSMHELQQVIAEQLPAVSFAFGTSSFPYRTDKIDGWINFPGWGVINPKTWYTASAK